METSTTIRQMLAGNRIFVPNYQRAYSWDTEFDSLNTPKQVNTFLNDLEEYNKGFAQSPYYFGHFLFEEKPDNRFGIIDGQQRLTTIVIFVSAIFERIREFRDISESEDMLLEDMIKRKSHYRFDSVDYDLQLFRDYVVDGCKKDHNNLETESAKRIVYAFDFLRSKLRDKGDAYLMQMLSTIQNATCSTHPVKDETEAIQMFIFQNNRGKQPSNLEVIKAQFLFNVHLYAKDEKGEIVEEIKRRFEGIYKSISKIEYKVDEDEVLSYTLRIYFNSLAEGAPLNRINQKLSEEDSLTFIRNFTRTLSVSFEQLVRFFEIDEKNSFTIHSLVTLGDFGIVMPFIIKAYMYNLSLDTIEQMCNAFESVVLRHRLIGTRAEITSRLNDVFKEFTQANPDISPITIRINWMKTVAQDSAWFAYWNNTELERSIQGHINPSVAKFLLWKYENGLEKNRIAGYQPTRYDKIFFPELEHIAPKTENPETGYDQYDDEFRNQHIDCLGNYLLLSKSHNCSLGNKPFIEKWESYKHSEQQREIREMTASEKKWTKAIIQQRKEKIIDFLMSNI